MFLKNHPTPPWPLYQDKVDWAGKSKSLAIAQTRNESAFTHFVAIVELFLWNC
jgi:hypothetical protein